MRLSSFSRGGAAAARGILDATVTPTAAKAFVHSRRRVSDERIEHPYSNEFEAREQFTRTILHHQNSAQKVSRRNAPFRKSLILLLAGARFRRLAHLLYFSVAVGW